MDRSFILVLEYMNYYFYYVSFQILDACAAPGSKTAQIIELLHGDNFYGIPGISDYYFLKVCVKLKRTEAQTF